MIAKNEQKQYLQRNAHLFKCVELTENVFVAAAKYAMQNEEDNVANDGSRKNQSEVKLVEKTVQWFH